MLRVEINGMSVKGDFKFGVILLFDRFFQHSQTCFTLRQVLCTSYLCKCNVCKLDSNMTLAITKVIVCVIFETTSSTVILSSDMNKICDAEWHNLTIDKMFITACTISYEYAANQVIYGVQVVLCLSQHFFSQVNTGSNERVS